MSKAPRATTAAAAPSGAARSVPNTSSGTAPGGMLIPDDELDELDASVFGDANQVGGIGLGTSDGEAMTNSAKLGASVQGAPIGMPKTIKIILEEAADDAIPPTGLPVSLNGRAYLIRPGEVVSVPPGIVEILENAIMSVPVKDPQTMKMIGHRPRLRFPFRRVA